MRTPPHQIEALAERIRALERAGAPTPAATGRSQLVPTGWPAVDAVLGGGLVAGVHEWLVDEGEARSGAGEAGAGAARSRPSLRSGRALGGDLAPLTLWMHLVRRALSRERPEGGGWSVWVGSRCFAYPHGLVATEAGAAVMERALFVDPAQAPQRLWAIDLAARSPAVAMVLADGSDVDMAATRRLQLAAEHGSTRIMLARPISERKALSAATTRWLVTPTPSPSSRPRWALTLCRCKGVQRGREITGTEVQHQWSLEGTHSREHSRREQGVVVVSLESRDRSAAKAAHPPSRRRRA